MLVYRLLKKISLPRYESLYIMFCPFDYPWRAKCGISQDGDIRKSQVRQSIKETKGVEAQIYHVRVPVLFARQNERFVHWLYRKMRYTGLWQTCGGSEWFWSANLLTFVLCWILFAHAGIKEPMWKAGFIMLLPLPIDFALLILVLAAIQYAAIFGIFYSLLYFVFA
jgi:hypothetical protein